MHSNEPVVGDPNDIMWTLKAETWELHELAEHHPYQRAFVKGELSRAAYTDYLAHMLLVHQVLESRLTDLKAVPGLSSVICGYHFRASLLRDDLAYFGATAEEVRPLGAAAAIVHEIEFSFNRDPLSVLGFLYVLEGSTNGSKFIARSVERSLKLNPRQGTSYLNPHAEWQSERWAEFKRTMNAQPFVEEQKTRIVECAKAMFRAVIRLSDDLWSRLKETNVQSRFESDRDGDLALDTLGAAS